jgi:predicted DNA-binding transcriptional regulator YafY
MPDEARPRRSESDRRLQQAARFARVLRVLELIQGRGRYGTKEIAAELECSERTIFRDLNVLELAGVPYEADRETHSIRVRPGYRFPCLGLTDDELVGQATATAAAATQGLDITSGARPTTRKLQVASRDEAAKLLAEVERVTSVLDLKLADHRHRHETVRTVQWALIQGKQLTGTYASPYESNSKRLTLHPYRLCLVKQAWYLVARPQDAEQPRTFRVTRFKTLRSLDTPSIVPEEFDLKPYFGNAWAVYRGDQAYDVEIRFSPDAADLVTETTWHRTQKTERHKDGSVTLRFVVDGLNEILYWVLGWSGRATVVRPSELRELVVEQLRKALEMNGTNRSSHYSTR